MKAVHKHARSWPLGKVGLAHEVGSCSTVPVLVLSLVTAWRVSSFDWRLSSGRLPSPCGWLRGLKNKEERKQCLETESYRSRQGRGREWLPLVKEVEVPGSTVLGTVERAQREVQVDPVASGQREGQWCHS